MQSRTDRTVVASLDRALDEMVEIARFGGIHQARNDALALLALIYLAKKTATKPLDIPQDSISSPQDLVYQIEHRHPSLGPKIPEHFPRQLSRYSERRMFEKWLQIASNPALSLDQFQRWFVSALDEVSLSSYFATPPSVAELMCGFFDDQRFAKVLDPACGTGGLLQAAVERFGKHALVDGIELNKEAAAWASLRFIVCDYNNVQIQSRDALSNGEYLGREHSERYDLIIANPPFGQVLKSHTAAELAWRGGNQIWGNNTRLASESAYVYLAYHHLSDFGAAAILVPNGLLIRGGADERLRNLLVKDNVLDAVVGLPGRVFGPGASIDASIVLLRRRGTYPHARPVLFVDGRNFGQHLAHRFGLTDENIKGLIATYKKREAVKGISELVPMEELETRNFSLLPAHFVKQVSTETKVNPFERRMRIDALDQHYASLREEYEELRAKLSGFKSD